MGWGLFFRFNALLLFLRRSAFVSLLACLTSVLAPFVTSRSLLWSTHMHAAALQRLHPFALVSHFSRFRLFIWGETRKGDSWVPGLSAVLHTAVVVFIVRLSTQEEVCALMTMG